VNALKFLDFDYQTIYWNDLSNSQGRRWKDCWNPIHLDGVSYNDSLLWMRAIPLLHHLIVFLWAIHLLKYFWKIQ